MSDLLFVKRQGNGDLQYCVPQGYEWAITDSHRRPRASLSAKHPFCKTSSSQKQENTAQKKWSLGPWQHVKLHPAVACGQRNPLPERKGHTQFHAGAPFCSIVSKDVGPCSVKLEAKAHAIYIHPPLADKPTELTLRQKEIIKARSATVLPVVAFSKNGEWVPQSLGRKAHARLTSHCTGGWSKRSVSILHGMHPATRRETGHCPYHKKDASDDKETEHSPLHIPHLHSSAFLLHDLHAAEEELKNAHASMHRASAWLEHYQQEPDMNKDHQSTRGRDGAFLQSEAQPHTRVSRRAVDGKRFSVRSCCTARKKKQTYPEAYTARGEGMYMQCSNTSEL